MSLATRPQSLNVQMGADTRATASPSERTISGLAVPYGAVGQSAFGALTFAKGSLAFGSPGRVKLLRQHDPNVSLGYATTLSEGDDGLHATFHVPPAPEGFKGDWPGDIALSEAASGTRDGLSVGVQLDDAVVAQVMDKWMNDDHTPTEASGQLLEVSQVSLPAFDDARIPSAAAAAGGHVTMSLFFEGTALPIQKEHAMPETLVSPPAAVEAAVIEPLAAPTPSPFASQFQVPSEAPVYLFDGTGPSFIRDMWRARYEQDFEAQARVARFNDRWVQHDAAQVGAFLRFAVETRTTEPEFIPQPYRPDLLVAAIDKGRPLTSRIGTVSLTDATPFRVPVEGDMTGGVGDHVEGTAHVPEGDLAVSDQMVTPGAISGAWRVSRELVDASNPALDQIGLRAMMRNYRYQTEAKVAAALDAADSTATASVNTVIEVRAQIDAYYDLNFYDPSGIAASPSFTTTLLSETDTTGRAMLATVNPQNAIGVDRTPGSIGAEVDGVEIHKAWAVGATFAYLYNAADVLIGESNVQTFRFEEVEGPGVVKLALWSYFAAKVTRASSVVKITSA